MIELIDREATVKQICKIGEMLGVGHDRDVTIAVALFVQDDKSAFPTIEAYTFEQVQDLVALNKKLSEEIPHADCRDRLKEVFREQSSIIGDMFHLSQIERIIDGEDWL